MKMITEERHSKIISALMRKKTLTVYELCELLKTSESTVRRDLTVLAKQGRLKKVHGGAVALESEIMMTEPDVQEKQQLNSEEKSKIAEYAAKTIKKNDFVFIDAGTTTERMIEYVTEHSATFVTNGFIHAHLLAKNGFKVYLTGGEVKPSTQALVGVSCVEAIKNYNFTKCFLGTNGITVEHGMTTPNVDEACVKRAALSQSYMTYVLADHTKFEKTAAVTFADLQNVCILTDKLPNEKYRNITVVKEVTL